MTPHHVLVVDDDLEIREALLDTLNDRGCHAVGAANGPAALQYLESANPLPCLIFLDLMMPVMDGQAFRRAQLSDPRIAHIPVVIVSAYRDVESNAQPLQAVAVIPKPLKVEQMLSAVGEHC